ncbi:LmbE family N-acetylglucosaminyl deacetylase [Ruminiclostridium sufflavum DSM 19573]|uniref:LmbE family N-acetylglucosaminyl deacetylase n=1 Tax=Ruminiclostridium sufflavum DSM 19573 TaxID=1121337 RepID=A0A318XRG8_9FIRM|nr:PIG-L family deacetylase [Ruminiclostridium sufflavum]PYG88716.1 LmbE family N-acetylglucosaminyl deacetylase [Ruminiclostridium sufflavum DSM 19573]
MNFNKNDAELFIPDGRPAADALGRTTCMAVAAHHDDIEIMAYHGIAQCFGREDEWFCGVVVTNGAGSPRNGLYEKYTDEEMQKVRKLEQKKAAYVGEYGSMALLGYTSSEAKDSANNEVLEEIKELIKEASPKVVYTHNLADKHDTHVAVAIRVIGAIRQLPPELRPQKVYGCEVWRSLDWVNDEEKLLFDVSAHTNIAAALTGVHDSQICGGKRYDLATEGRRLANATYSESHGTDGSSALSCAMDLTPLIKEDSLDISKYIQDYIERFKNDVAEKIRAFSS